jgi:hypothetical protein
LETEVISECIIAGFWGITFDCGLRFSAEKEGRTWFVRYEKIGYGAGNIIAEFQRLGDAKAWLAGLETQLELRRSSR